MVTDSDPAKFAQITRNLKILADQLLKQHPDYAIEEFGRAFTAVAVSLLLAEVGDAATADWLRGLAAELESRNAHLTTN